MSDDLPGAIAGEFPEDPNIAGARVTRRGFFGEVAVTGAVVAPWPSAVTAQMTGASGLAEPAVSQGVESLSVSLTVNGTPQRLDVDVRTTLLDLLRERLALPGTKKGCDHGQCGACTVLVDGQRINSCLALAVVHDGAEIVTIEGLATGGRLHPLQAAFVEHDAFQCGYCTPGQICSAVGMINELRAGMPSQVTADVRAGGAIASNDDELRERMSGNLCRCGAYPGILAAVRQVAWPKSRRAP